MPLLDLQRRFRELGRIRLGQKVPTKSGKMAPSKLYTFRLTSPSEHLVRAAAQVYGGECQPWNNDGKSEFEVVTDAAVMDIIVPPGQVLSQHWEMWSGGGCVRRCDGQRELLADQACLCPSDYDERRELAATGKACKPTSRLNLMLRALPDIGVWRLESRGMYAAIELAGTAEILEMATKQGQMIPARLRLDPREKKRPGQPVNKFVVPVIEIAATFGQVAEALGLPVASDNMPALPRVGGEGGAATPQARTVTDTSAVRAALPAAPKGRQPKTALPSDAPPLPDDPTFTFASSTAPALPPVFEMGVTTADAPKARPQVDAQTKRAQQLHIAAKNSNCLDMLDELVAYVTEGRSRSTKDVGDNEASTLYDIMFRLKRGKLTAAYDPDGTLRLVEQ